VSGRAGAGRSDVPPGERPAGRRPGAARGAGDGLGPRRLDLGAVRTPEAAARLAADIAAARLVCFPTDTVYGIGGALSPAVAAAVVAAKGRDEGKPLQVVYPALAGLRAAVGLGPRLADAVRRLLPGPFTLLLPYPAGWRFPPPGRVAHGPPGGPLLEVPTLGVRVPRWPAGAAALAGLPFPLLASSANPSGETAPGSLDAVDPALLAVCDLALDAGAVDGLASTVLDLSEYEEAGRWHVLRRGVVTEDEVAALLAAPAEGG
jgi:L-threonylcarbamoyladenylate synthase